jgi:hypothetical protein
MARRKKLSRKLQFGIVAAVLLLLAAFVLIPTVFDGNRTKARLNYDEYIENPRAYSGNFYFIEGKIADRLARSKSGAVYAITAGNHSLAVVIPAPVIPKFNIEKGQTLFLDIQVADEGALVATAVSKK